MTDYFEFPVAYNPDGNSGQGELVAGATFLVYAEDDASFTTPLPVTDPVSGAAIVPLKSSAVGVLPSFSVAGDPETVILKSGSFTTKLISMRGRQGEPGKSAYEQAVEGGYAGTEEAFTSTLANVGDWVDQGTVDSSGDLILTTARGDSINAGSVVGPAGPAGPGMPDPSSISDNMILVTSGGAWTVGPVPAGGGRDVQMQASPQYIQWRHVGDETWQNLIEVADLKGADGARGADGANGTNGQSPQLRFSGGFVQWKFPTDSTWLNLIAQADITGPKGDKGDKGDTGAAGVPGVGITEYGLWPRIVWAGSWPSRASSIPAGYTGPVEYWSPTDSAATSPSDMAANDVWMRRSA